MFMKIQSRQPPTRRIGSFQQLLLTMSLGVLIAGELAGCGASNTNLEFHHDLVPISGAVLLKGKPLAGASLTFSPTGEQAVRAAYAMTDAEGKYHLMTPIHGVPPAKSQGAVPNHYRVIISKLLMPDGDSIPAGMTTADAMEKGAKESLPPQYSDEASTVLSADVVKGAPQTNLNFSLP